MQYHQFKILVLSLIASFILFSSCDHGIAPLPVNPEPAGFTGRITFIGTWPDSIKRTHLVVFKDPLLEPGDFNILNLKFVSWEIPFGISVYYYSSRDSSVIPGTGAFNPGEYAYVAVAQQFTENLSLNRRDWFVAGVFYSLNDESRPGKLIIPNDTYVWNININCDFDNPPPQPPGGF